MDPEFSFDPTKIESLSKKRADPFSQESAKRSHLEEEALPVEPLISDGEPGSPHLLLQTSEVEARSISPRRSRRLTETPGSPAKEAPNSPTRTLSPPKVSEGNSPMRIRGESESSPICSPRRPARESDIEEENETNPIKSTDDTLKDLEEIIVQAAKSPSLPSIPKFQSLPPKKLSPKDAAEQVFEKLIEEDASQLDKKISLRFIITSREAGVIIGKGGANVAEVRRATGMIIKVTPQVPNVNDRIMTFDGTLGALGKTVVKISTMLAERGLSDYLKPGQAELVMLIPTERMGFLIGKGGARVKELQNTSGCKINSKSGCIGDSDERTMSFVGEPEQLQVAIHIVGTQIGDHYSTPDGEKVRLYEPGKQRSRRRDSGDSRSEPSGSNSNRNAPLPTNSVPDIQSIYANLYPQMQMLQQFQNQAAPFQYPNVAQGQPNTDVNATLSNTNLNAILQQATQFYAQNMANLSSSNTVNPQDTLKLLQSQYQNMYNGPSQQSSQRQSSSASLPPPRNNPDGTQTQDMFIPGQHVGAIIGKRGAIIKDIRATSRCEVLMINSRLL